MSFRRTALDANIQQAAEETARGGTSEAMVPWSQVSSLVLSAYVKAIARSFVEWHKDEYFAEDEPEYQDHKMALIRWLRIFGAGLMSRYDVFKMVCEELARGGFNTMPPPSEDEFERAVADSIKLRARHSVLRRISRQGFEKVLESGKKET